MTKLAEATPDQKIEQLESWLSNLCYSDMTGYMTKKIIPDSNELRVLFSFYTDENKYNITASPEGKNGGYLGCTMVKRAPYPGEKHVRGNDLPDGRFSEETFESIKDAIIRTELKPLYVAKRLV